MIWTAAGGREQNSEFLGSAPLCISGDVLVVVREARLTRRIIDGRIVRVQLLREGDGEAVADIDVVPEAIFVPSGFIGIPSSVPRVSFVLTAQNVGSIYNLWFPGVDVLQVAKFCRN